MIPKGVLLAGQVLLLCWVAGCGSKAEKNMASICAYIAMNTPEIVSSQVVQESLASVLPESIPVSDLKVDTQSISFKAGKYTCIAVLADFPIPWGDLEGPCATSWMWKDATERMKVHKAHMVVILQGDGPRTERCLLLTKTVAALAAVHDTAGIYWGDGTVVHEPKFFVERARTSDPENLPVILWIEFRIQGNPDGTVNVITTGLEAFDLMEVEVIGTKQKAMDVLNVVAGAAAMMLQGEIFADGDTVGPEANTRIPTRHAPSIWDRKGKVLRVEM